MVMFFSGQLRYGIKSKGVRIGPETPKGFAIDQFHDAFNRYLVDLSATPQQSSNGEAYSVAEANTVAATSATPQHNVADKTQRCGNEIESATLQTTDYAGCGVVADNEGVNGKMDDDWSVI